MSKSCTACPSSFSSNDMLGYYGGTLGCGFCPTKGVALDNPTFKEAVNVRLRERIAETCDSYGQSPPTKENANVAATVATGDPAIAVRMAQLGRIPDLDKPMSCTSCSWFVPGDVVANELGWDAPLCAAKGRLLFPRNLMREAANCGSGLNGTNLRTTDGIILHEFFKTGTPIAMQPKAPVQVNLTVEADKHSVDPRQYVSDRPVTPEDEARCIRAWRSIVDPEGLNDPAWLPIYDGQKLCGSDPRTTYGRHRPDLYVDHQGILYDLATEFELEETPVLIGGAGTGKTETGCWLAWLMDIPFTRLSIEKGTESWHFIGESKLVTDPITGLNVTEFAEGRFPPAYRGPGVVMIDEPNLKQEIYEFLRPVFDNAGQLMLDAAQGVQVTKGAATYVMCSQNPSWDPLYVGAEPMSAADVDRISPIFFDLPSPEVERLIIRKHCADGGYEIPDEKLDAIMQIATDLRSMIDQGSLPIAWGLRAQIKVARKTRRYSIQKAYRRAVIDGMEPSVVEQIMSAVRNVAS